MTDDLNVAGPIRLAIIANTAVAPLLAQWEGEPAVFTRRPVPADAPKPFILVAEPMDGGSEDGLTRRRPTQRRDLLVVGENPDDYRVVDQIGFLLWRQFHQNNKAIVPGPTVHVMDIEATQPMRAPTDDESEVARLVALRLRLEDLAS